MLSINEAEKFFDSANERQCAPTDYAVANGVYVNKANNNCCWWWLRMPGSYLGDASSIGDVSRYGNYVGYIKNAVYPAMWIDLSKIN